MLMQLLNLLTAAEQRMLRSWFRQSTPTVAGTSRYMDAVMLITGTPCWKHD